ncbi:glucosaminidase domain-containing protein [Marinilactibacillus psychrotolerans]|uniref:glucosaminidase domain-containing protein n=1 Tax=Marinilactibacillus psychrotolerans TaxID=191770 RepID=UPI00382D1B82
MTFFNKFVKVAAIALLLVSSLTNLYPQVIASANQIDRKYASLQKDAINNLEDTTLKENETEEKELETTDIDINNEEKNETLPNTIGQNGDSKIEKNIQVEESIANETDLNKISPNQDVTEKEEAKEAEVTTEVEKENVDEYVYDREYYHDYALNINDDKNNRVSTSSTQWPFSSYPTNVKNFISEHGERAKKYANEKNLYPSVMLAQAILESGWGSSKLSSPPYHQLFGIKDNNFSGETITMPTKEWVKDANRVNGGYFITINASFRVYPSYNEAFSDQARFLKVNTRYKNVFRNEANTYQDATKALQAAGYATDKDYALKLNSLIQKWDLTRLDEGVAYSTHIEKKGNIAEVRNGQLAGTVGSKLRLESLNMKLENLPNSNIQYRTHIESYGWQDWKSTGKMSGTVGEAKRLEAVQIKLSGEAAQRYDIYYRVHVEHYGWLDWAKNGEKAGTEGYKYRMEALQVQLVPKGNNISGRTANLYRKAPTLVAVSTHVQEDGWQDYVRNGKASGSSGEGKRLEGIRLKLENKEYSGEISYKTHIQSIGWQDWKSQNQVAGTSGMGKRLEAIEIKLTGEMTNKYDIYYRTHIQSEGWLGWAKNGEQSGSSGKSLRLESIEVKLIPKGNKAPGSTAKHFIQ